VFFEENVVSGRENGVSLRDQAAVSTRQVVLSTTASHQMQRDTDCRAEKKERAKSLLDSLGEKLETPK